jgi:hypothetical protein
MKKLLNRSNRFPLNNLNTRIDLGDNENGKIDIRECILYYYFTGCRVAKINI